MATPLTPRQAWETVRAQIVTANRVVPCTPLIDFLRCAITISQAGNDPTISQLPSNVPLAPPYLLDRRRSIVERDFPTLNQKLTNL